MATEDRPLDAALLAGLLADEARRRVVASLVLGDSTIEGVRERTGLAARAAATAISRLVDAGLVLRADDGEGLFLLREAFGAAAMASASERTDEHADAPAGSAAVLRAFVRDGRLAAIPVQRAKLVVVLDRLAQEFEPGRRYPERQVNAILRRWHPDVAALRRHLVDEGFCQREAGVYWRSGGTYEP